MKIKLKSKRDRGVLSLIVEGDKEEEIDYADAEHIRGGLAQSFVPLAYEKKRKAYRLSYQVVGLARLSDLAKGSLAPHQLRALLVSVLNFMRDCEEGGLMRQRVALEPEHILYDCTRCSLRFVYVPLQSFVSSSADLNGMLVYLCEHVRVPCSELGLVQAVLDYAQRTPIITGIEFAAFLRGLGVVLPEETTTGCESASYAASENARPSVTDVQVPLSTDQLTNRTKHGFNFVSEQTRCSINESKGSGEAFPAKGFELVRLSTGEGWIFSDGRFIVGRTAECDCRPQGVRGLSRKHAVFVVSGSTCIVRDLDSTNGVVVNGVRIASSFDMRIYRGDKLALGEEGFELL